MSTCQNKLMLNLAKNGLLLLAIIISCDRTILIDPVGPEMRDDEGDLIFPADTVLVICPHCELESLYQSDEIRCEQEQQRH